MTGSVPGSMSISEWAPYWRNELGARGVRPATVRLRMNRLARLAKFYDGPPEEITAGTLVQWRDSMRNETVDWRGSPIDGLAVSTVNGHLGVVAMFLNWLVEEGVIGKAPKVRLLSERNQPAPPVFNPTDLRALSVGAGEAAQGRSKYEATRDLAVVALLQDSGLRASECAGLLLENLNLPARQVFVHEAVAKGGRPRTVTFGFHTARLLNRYVIARRAHAYANAPQLFLGRQGPASYPLVRRIVQAAGKRAGVEGARPHLLRHSWAHGMKDSGVSMETLMSLGGWSSTEMPMKYGRSGREARAVAEYERLGSPVDNRPKQ